jgi:hypothetical protein
LDWLNERTDEKIRLLGLGIELWRIDDSPLAPKFNIISKTERLVVNSSERGDKANGAL